MQGSKQSLAVIILFTVLAGLTACAKATGAPSLVRVPASGMASLSLRIGDVPLGSRLMVDLTPTNAQLPAIIHATAPDPSLETLSRQAGSYRVFTYASEEPSVLNVTVRAVVEVDLFTTSDRSRRWMDERQTDLAKTAGPLYPTGAPGQSHAVRLTSYHAGDIVATTTSLAFVDRNAYVEITTTSVGPGISVADPERFARLIAARLDHPAP